MGYCFCLSQSLKTKLNILREITISKSGYNSAPSLRLISITSVPQQNYKSENESIFKN